MQNLQTQEKLHTKLVEVVFHCKVTHIIQLYLIQIQTGVQHQLSISQREETSYSVLDLKKITEHNISQKTRLSTSNTGQQLTEVCFCQILQFLT